MYDSVYCSNPVSPARSQAIRRGVSAAIKRLSPSVRPVTVETIQANGAAVIIANALRYVAAGRN